jgi:hypothetical protein
MEAETEADRVAVRDHYASMHGPMMDKGRGDREPEKLDASNDCDHLKLKAADLTECRAQWKSARDADARGKIIARYKAVAKGDRSGSRREPIPTHDPWDNGGASERD